MPVLLAFDTATEHLAVAVIDGDGVHGHDGAGGARASSQLLPVARRLLAERGHTLQDVEAIAFGRGPGAFTGLRTACSVAQGLAFGLGRPVLPLSTLLVVAEDARAQADPCRVWVTMDARMGEVYAACFFHEQGAWHTEVEPLLADPAGWASVAQAHPHRADLVAGTALDVFGAALVTGASVRRPSALPRSAALGRLALQAWKRGEGGPAAEALPLYLRDKVAYTTVEREAARAAKEAAA